jgi:outer membrane protein assembly factor BamB
MKIIILLAVLVSLSFTCAEIAGAEDLTMIWSKELGGGSKSDTVQSVVLVADSHLVSVNLSGEIFSLSIEDGKELWRTHLGRRAGRRGFALANDFQSLFVFGGKTLFELDAKTGEIKSSLRLKASVTPPIIDGDAVYVAYTSGVLAKINWPKKTLDWELDIGSTARIWSPTTFSKKYGLLYVATSNPGGLFAENRPENTEYSSSLVAIDTATGKIKFNFQDVFTDVWDFDATGQPIFVEGVELHDRRVVDLIVQLTKTGRVIALEAASGKEIFPNQFNLIRVNNSISNGQEISPIQREYIWPESVSSFVVDPESFRSGAFNQALLRHAKYEKFLPPSVNYDVVMKGLHGGAEWFGGKHFRANNIDFLAIPYNDYPWILRGEYRDKSLINKIFDSIEKRLRKIIRLWGNSEQDIPKSCHENIKPKVGGMPNPVQHRWSQEEWVYPKDTAAAVREKIQKYMHFSIFNSDYYKHCSSCHSVNRRGNYQSELSGTGYVPSLVGYSLTEKFKKFKNIDQIRKLHDSEFDLSQSQLDSMYEFFHAYDEELLENNKLSVKGFWQPLSGNDGLPLTTSPWGGLAILNLNSGKVENRISLGRLVGRDGSLHEGSMIFGGISEVSSDGKALLVGTVSENAYYLDLINQKILQEIKLTRSGSVSPTLIDNGVTNKFIVTETGGRFFWYKNNGHRISVFEGPKN